MGPTTSLDPSATPTDIARDNLRGVRLFTTTGYSHHFEARNPGMLGAIAKSLFGSSNDRYVKSIFKTVERINGFEPAMSAMSDDRSEERRVGKECVSTCRYRWSTYQ